MVVAIAFLVNETKFSPNREGEEVKKTIDHLVNKCPIYIFQSGMSGVQSVSKWVLTLTNIFEHECVSLNSFSILAFFILD